MQTAQNPWTPPTAAPKRGGRGGSWQWLVPAFCVATSLASFLFAQVQMFSFEPTHDALFTEFVYRPLARASGQALVVSVAATVTAVLLRRWRERGAGLFGLSLVCTLCVLSVAVLTLDGFRETDHRMHPEARMLDALRHVPVAPDWQLLSPAALEPLEDLPGGELQGPSAHATFAPGHGNNADACAELAAVLAPAGWERSSYSCSFFYEKDHIRITASLADEVSSPQVVTFTADTLSR